MPRKLASALIAAAILMPAAALAMPHGKPGLWNITTTMQMAAMPKMPPEVVEMMKKRGIKLPQPGQPMTNQICMTAEQAAMDHPPNMDRDGIKCTPHVISQTSNSATTEITCHGTMEGTGRSQISWRGDSHYEGHLQLQRQHARQSQQYEQHLYRRLGKKRLRFGQAVQRQDSVRCEAAGAEVTNVPPG